MSYQIIWENNGVISRFYGVLRPEIHIAALNALFGDSRIEDVKYIIGDFSQVNGHLLSEKDIEYPVAVTAGAASYLKNLKIALVAKDEEIIDLCKGYIELFGQINTTWEVRLFDNLDAAKDWLASA